MTPPAGFKPHQKHSPLTAPWEPIYAKHETDRVILGLTVGAAHTNSRGFVHGGLLAALADNAMGLSCIQGVGQNSSGVTVNLAVDYLAVVNQGVWIEFRPTVIKRGKSLSVAECHIVAADRTIARANATFKHLVRG